MGLNIDTKELKKEVIGIIEYLETKKLTYLEIEIILDQCSNFIKKEINERGLK